MNQVMKIENVRPQEGRNTSVNSGSLKGMIGVGLRQAQNRALSVFATHVDAGLAPGHYSVLKLIDLNPGETQSALAKAAGIDRSTIVPVLDQFEKAGWVRRSPAKRDRRAYALYLTAKGRRTIASLDTKVGELEKRIKALLGAEDHQNLLQLLQRFQDVLTD